MGRKSVFAAGLLVAGLIIGRQCDSPDFKSAGAHFNPDETKHGLMNAEGPHAGDMPNLHVPESAASSWSRCSTNW